MLIALIVFIWLLLLTMFFIQVLLHEAGHLLFGLLTGYSFMAFRIFSVTLAKKDGRYLICHYTYPGSFGQCIMLPPDNNRNPFVLHVMGGVIMNVAVAVAASIIALSSLHISFIPRLSFLIFSFYGLGFAIMNGIPIKSLTISNDGMVLRDLSSRPVALTCYKKQLKIAYELFNGTGYGELPYDLIDIPLKQYPESPLIGYQLLLRYYYCLDRADWDAALNALNQINGISNSNAAFRRMIHMERLFYKVILGEYPVIDAAAKKEIKSLKMTVQDINEYRICIVLKYFLEPEKIDLKDIQKKLDKLDKNYLYRGEVDFCRAMINKVLYKQ
jgi:hypothetical protein